MKILLIGITHPVVEKLYQKLYKDNQVRFIHYKKLNTNIMEAVDNERFDLVVSLAPIWKLKNMIKEKGIIFSKIIALSSTSVMSKSNSNILDDKRLSNLYIDGENDIIEISKSYKATYKIFRTTMLWGHNYDLNISRIIRIAKKFRFIIFPFPSSGLRAPIHFDSLSDFLFKKITSSHNKVSDIVVIAGDKIYKLNEIINIISKKYKSLKFPIFISYKIMTYLGIITKLKIFNFIAGFIERSNKNLDFHKIKNMEIELIPQETLDKII